MTRHAEIPTDFDEKEWAKKVKRLRRANRDIGQRAEAYLLIEYSPERDYLYVTLEQDKSNLTSADYLDSDAAFEVAYYDPDSYVIGGFDVPSFLQKTSQRSFTDFWSLVAARFGKGAPEQDGIMKRYEPKGREAKKLAVALQAVVDQAA